MDLKARPNHAMYIRSLRGMSPSQRSAKAFELSAMTKRLFLDGLRSRFPDRSDAEIHQLYLARLAKCHNRNY